MDSAAQPRMRAFVGVGVVAAVSARFGQQCPLDLCRLVCLFAAVVDFCSAGPFVQFIGAVGIIAYVGIPNYLAPNME